MGLGRDVLVLVLVLVALPILSIHSLHGYNLDSACAGRLETAGWLLEGLLLISFDRRNICVSC